LERPPSTFGVSNDDVQTVIEYYVAYKDELDADTSTRRKTTGAFYSGVRRTLVVVVPTVEIRSSARARSLFGQRGAIPERLGLRSDEAHAVLAVRTRGSLGRGVPMSSASVFAKLP
jgi:hypothetical protein